MRILHYGDHHARAGQVRNCVQAAKADISDAVLNKFITDEQAFGEAYVEKTFG
jgi:capsid portal protein